jgi:ubiquinone/menaquinone biosynthesis C-methylase UbiE
MALSMDPAGDETLALEKATEWTGKRVLEIGCGEGRLTLRLASLGPAGIVAIDPDPDLIKSARANLPEAERGRIQFHVSQAQDLKYKPGTFDTVVFSWAL